MKVVNFQLDSADPLFICTHLDGLPFLKGKIRSGTSGVLRTYGGSPMSWTSFWTGQPPWIHGIDGFWKDSRHSYAIGILGDLVNNPQRLMRPSTTPIKRAIKALLLALRSPLLPIARLAIRASERDQQRQGRKQYNRSDIRWVTGYELMEKAGLEVGLVNNLLTYPVWDTNGYIVSDWTMPGDAHIYYAPLELRQYLEEVGYKATLDRLKRVWDWLGGRIGDDVEVIYKLSLEEFEKTKQVTIYLMKECSWDFHSTMFRLLDTVHHLFADDPKRLLEAYTIVDRGLAEITREAGIDDHRVCWLINSDHGAYAKWPKETIRGAHDESGFYCFSCDGLFRAGVTRTLRIEALMPIVLHLFGIDPLVEMKAELVDDIYSREADLAQDEDVVVDRLKALGYL